MNSAAGVLRVLQANGATIAVAESLTGGLLTAALTETAGSSAVVRGGVVVYATELKSLLAGVDAALLAERGPVDPEVAGALAAGVRTALGATIGVAVTGVAGPDRQHGVAVGTVFGALAGPGGVQTREWHFDGMRGEVRAAAVQACLTLIGTEFERVR